MGSLEILTGKKCPSCNKNKLEIRIHKRVNYPFGKKSRPRLVKKRIEEVCMNEHKDKKDKIVWSCKYSDINTYKY